VEDPAHRASIDRLLAFIAARQRDAVAPPALHDQAMLLWAAARLPALLDNDARQAYAAHLIAAQAADGGWSLAGWGRGARPISDDGAASDG
jgi:hypothetical protein